MGVFPLSVAYALRQVVRKINAALRFFLGQGRLLALPGALTPALKLP
jgi:hypothetical protein